MVIPASPGPSEKCFDINIIDDRILENSTHLQVNFEIPGTNAEVGSINSTQIFIVDRKEFKNFIMLILV